MNLASKFLSFEVLWFSVFLHSFFTKHNGAAQVLQKEVLNNIKLLSISQLIATFMDDQSWSTARLGSNHSLTV